MVRKSSTKRRRARTRLTAAAVAAAAAVPLLAACGSGYSPGVINVYAPADGADQITARAAICNKESGGAYRAAVTILPKDADGQRLQLARRLAGNDHGLDVMAMDVVWTAEFANAGWLVPVPDAEAEQVIENNLAGPVETAMWKRPDDAEKRLYALPIWTNTELMWYRPDVLKKFLGRKSQVPVTWDQMIENATEIHRQDPKGPTQILVQGSQYEGLMVWFNSVLQSAGGHILDPDDPSKQTLNDTPEHRAATLRALQILKAVSTYPGADPSISNSDEGSARDGMERGEAAFEINWPFVFDSARKNGASGNIDFLKTEMAPFAKRILDEENPPTAAELVPINRELRTRFDFALYPGVSKDLPAKSTLGGLNIAVASTSRQPELAAKVASCLTSKDAQRVYALEGALPPTVASLYDEKDFKVAYPMGDDIRTQLEADHVAPRPATPQYQAMSTLVTATLSPVGRWDPASMVDKLAEQVQKAIDGEGIIP
ncbi:extracellular solute-binding protein [Gordonia sp. PP30]|uniref:extracellular solute-binding protein n=1 Tax=unclassified Gordonia (in: high G+C Gram-positive bacteria) TaxID=2657482 RepID=UPI001FFFF62A|nr:extracellular solute-binding protein [Gordonia sp. PP30]UQE76291.1 extracellular solute-binding protein [Gordonia sp. PP30]